MSIKDLQDHIQLLTTLNDELQAENKTLLRQVKAQQKHIEKLQKDNDFAADLINNAIVE